LRTLILELLAIDMKIRLLPPAWLGWAARPSRDSAAFPTWLDVTCRNRASVSTNAETGVEALPP
jgi:hypothetical protein